MPRLLRLGRPRSAVFGRVSQAWWVVLLTPGSRATRDLAGTVWRQQNCLLARAREVARVARRVKSWAKKAELAAFKTLAQDGKIARRLSHWNRSSEAAVTRRSRSCRTAVQRRAASPATPHETNQRCARFIMY